MNWAYQRTKVKPKAKCCDWCRHFNGDFECQINGLKYGLTHRLLLKFNKEHWDFRYCKHYKYSKYNFKAYKDMCEENARATGYVGL